MEFKGEIFSNYYSRRVKWQQGVTAGTDLVCMFWSDHFILSHWHSGGWQGKVVVQWLGIIAQSGSVRLGFSVVML